MHYPQENNDKRLLELLEKWQSGDFTKQNEQELRSLAATDEFRREAVEGYLSTPEADHIQTLDALRSKIKGHSKRRNPIPINRWMAMAAALVLLVGAYWFLRPEGRLSESIPSVAQSTPEKDAQLEIASPAPPLPDTKPKPIEKKALDKLSSGTRDQTNAELASDYSAQTQISSPVAAAPAATVQDEEAPASKLDRTSSRAESIPVEDNIALAKEEESKSKVALKKQSLPGKASKPSPSSSTSLGYMDFKVYLRDNARLPDAAKNNNISGYVTVKFTLAQNKIASNPTIVKSLGYGCDQEALRLVLAYKWTTALDTTITVDVPFVR